jgi:hypothetical protein
MGRPGGVSAEAALFLTVIALLVIVVVLGGGRCLWSLSSGHCCFCWDRSVEQDVCKKQLGLDLHEDVAARVYYVPPRNLKTMLKCCCILADCRESRRSAGSVV